MGQIPLCVVELTLRSQGAKRLGWELLMHRVHPAEAGLRRNVPCAVYGFVKTDNKYNFPHMLNIYFLCIL